MNTLEKIEQQIKENPVILYMKGSPNIPLCGFSAKAVQCINACGVNFAYVDVIENPEIRQTLPSYSEWPTFPQLFIQGELIGGSDIITELFEQGELQTMLNNSQVTD